MEELKLRPAGAGGLSLSLAKYCAGSKLLTAYTMEYQYTSAGNHGYDFKFIQGKFRDYHPWDKEWNDKGRNIRPGARYQVW